MAMQERILFFSSFIFESLILDFRCAFGHEFKNKTVYAQFYALKCSEDEATTLSSLKVFNLHQTEIFRFNRRHVET